MCVLGPKQFCSDKAATQITAHYIITGSGSVYMFRVSCQWFERGRCSEMRFVFPSADRGLFSPRFHQKVALCRCAHSML